MKFFEKVHFVARQIPCGRVATYGQIAIIIGHPRAARQVGWAMNQSPEDVPAHRVVNREGVLSGADAFMFENTQASMLRGEGVAVEGRKVDLERYRWEPTIGEVEAMYYWVCGEFPGD